MDDYKDQKNRGRLHLKNKSKYKGITKNVAPKNAVKKSPIPLQSNWNKYAEDEEESKPYEPELPVGSNFAVLESAPISKGSHFQFKTDTPSEYLIQSNILDTSNLFNLDLNMLGLSIASIPFIQRCNIPECFFTEAEKCVIKKTAESNAVLYHKTVKETDHLSSIQEVGKVSYEQVPTHNEKLGVLDLESQCLTIMPRSENYVEFSFRNQDNYGTKNFNSQIEELGELEGDLDRQFLTKPSASAKKNSNATELGATEKAPVQESGSSILETESLQAWLDDILGD